MGRRWPRGSRQPPAGGRGSSFPKRPPSVLGEAGPRRDPRLVARREGERGAAGDTRPLRPPPGLGQLGSPRGQQCAWGEWGRSQGWGPARGVQRAGRTPSGAHTAPALLRLWPGAPGGADPDRGWQRGLARGVALAGEPVAAGPRAPLRGRAGGREVAAVRRALLRHVSPAPLGSPPALARTTSAFGSSPQGHRTRHGLPGRAPDVEGVVP